jgi:hypothetical protein
MMTGNLILIFLVITADIFTRLLDLNFNQSKLSKLSF